MNGYSETLDYLYGLEKFGMVFGLDNIRWILSLIDNPQDAVKTVHVAGTNGKGSVVAMLSQVLRAAGYTTGAYTSPHLVSFTERITINGEPIREEEVVELARLIKERIDASDPERRFTFFDFTTALAFLYFKRKGIDIARHRGGAGGKARLDERRTTPGLDHHERCLRPPGVPGQHHRGRSRGRRRASSRSTCRSSRARKALRSMS